MVDIIGPIAGLGKCKKCHDELRDIEFLMSCQPHLFGFFSSYHYTETVETRGMFYKEEFRVVELKKCSGRLSFQEKSGKVRKMRVDCAD